MKILATILMLIFTVTVSFCQSDSSHRAFADTITPNSPLFIQYNHGTCHISHRQQIFVEHLSLDSLKITMKRYLPIAYRHYKYNNKKNKYEAQDSIQIKDPFSFKFPRMADRDYCTVTREYLQEASFAVSHHGFLKFMNEFISHADNNKLELFGTGIAGIYCYIELVQNNLKKEYSFDGWYYLDANLILRQ